MSAFEKERDFFIHKMEQMIASLKSDTPNFDNRWYYVSALNDIKYMAEKMIDLTAREIKP